jgi:hypothetical protein
MNYSQLITAVQDYVQQTFTGTQLATFVQQAEQRIYNIAQPANLRKNMTGVLSSGNKYLSTPTDFLSVYSLALIKADGEYVYLLNKDVNFIREVYPNPATTGQPKYYALFGPTVASGIITTELSIILGPTPNDSYNVELHYNYYPDSIVPGYITALGAITAGSGYINGVYEGVPLTGGNGSEATATITVAGGKVTSVVIENPGVNYRAGNSLSASGIYIGGSGTGFAVAVSTVNNISGTSWLGDNFDTVLLYGTIVEAYTYLKGEPDLLALYDGKYKEALSQYKEMADGKQRGDRYRDGQVKYPVR